MKADITLAVSLLKEAKESGRSQFPFASTYNQCFALAMRKALCVEIIDGIHHMNGATGQFRFSNADCSFKFFPY